MPGKGLRIGAVQVWFKGGGHRGYLLACKLAGRRRYGPWPAQVSARSLPFIGLNGEFDLRNRDQAAELEHVMGGLDLSETN